MTSRHRLLSSVLSTKLIIGATGILLFLYLIVHIAGNLMVFLGQDTFNKYSYMPGFLGTPDVITTTSELALWA